MTVLLEVRDLRVRFAGGVDALRGLTLTLEPGEALGIVGESGAGKSTLAHCTIGLIQPPEAEGSVLLAGSELIGAPEDLLRSLRWSTVAIVPQSAALNPVVRVGDQIAEPLREQGGMAAAAARRSVEELAGEVLLDPALLERHPHQLSGGQRRQVLLAMAMALDPALVVLDEPTAGVDPAGRAVLLERIAKLAGTHGFALLVLTHDLPAAAALASRCLMLYAGEVVEAGEATAVIGRPAHPYSRALVNAYPVMSTTKDLRPIRGQPPDPRAIPPGCAFHPRCTQAESICSERTPLLESSRGRLVACHFGGVKILLSATGTRYVRSMTFRSSSRRARRSES